MQVEPLDLFAVLAAVAAVQLLYYYWPTEKKSIITNCYKLPRTITT